MSTININPQGFNPNQANTNNNAGSPLPPPPAPRPVTPMPSANGMRPGQRPIPPRSPQAAGSNAGKKVAVGLGAAAVAGGATAAAMAFSGNEEDLVEMEETQVEEPVAEETAAEETAEAAKPEAPKAHTPAAPKTPQQPSTPKTPAEETDPEAAKEPATDEETPATGEDTPEGEKTPDGEQTPGEGETPANGEDTPAGEQTPGDEDTPAGEEVQPTILDPEDPDEIAESIVSGDQEDPNEYHEGSIFQFDEVGMVYTVEGDELMAGSYTNEYGEELVMVDLDNDGFFDVAADQNGDIVYGTGDLALSVSDAEEQANSEGYLAQTDAEIDTFENEMGDEYLDDIVTV